MMPVKGKLKQQSGIWWKSLDLLHSGCGWSYPETSTLTFHSKSRALWADIDTNLTTLSPHPKKYAGPLHKGSLLRVEKLVAG